MDLCVDTGGWVLLFITNGLRGKIGSLCDEVGQGYLLKVHKGSVPIVTSAKTVEKVRKKLVMQQQSLVWCWRGGGSVSVY